MGGSTKKIFFAFFFLTPLLLTFTVYKTKNGPPPLRFPFFSTKTGGDKRSRRIFCVRVFWKTVPVTFSLSPNIREKCVFVCPALPRAAAGAQQSFPPSVWTASSSVFMSGVYFCCCFVLFRINPQRSWIVKRLSSRLLVAQITRINPHAGGWNVLPVWRRRQCPRWKTRMSRHLLRPHPARVAYTSPVRIFRKWAPIKGRADA